MCRAGRQSSQLGGAVFLCRRLSWQLSGGRQAAILQTHPGKEVGSAPRAPRTGSGVHQRRDFLWQWGWFAKGDRARGTPYQEAFKNCTNSHDKDGQRVSLPQGRRMMERASSSLFSKQEDLGSCWTARALGALSLQVALVAGWAVCRTFLSWGLRSQSAPRGTPWGVIPSPLPPEATVIAVRQQTHHSLLERCPHLRSHRPPTWSSTTRHTIQPSLPLAVICPGPSSELICSFAPRNQAEASRVMAAWASHGGCTGRSLNTS